MITLSVVSRIDAEQVIQRWPANISPRGKRFSQRISLRHQRLTPMHKQVPPRYLTHSEQRFGSLVPQGMIGTLEVEFSGLPSISLSV